MVGSKELIPVRGRPLIDHLAELLGSVGPIAIRVVTRPDKRDLIAYARSRGWEIHLGTPDHVAASILVGISGLPDDQLILTGFPDTLIEAPDAAVRTLAALVDGGGPAVDVALGLFHCAEPERGDVVSLAEDGSITAVTPKPTEPDGDLVWGLVAARVGALHELATVAEPGHLWHRWANDRLRPGRVRGTVIPGTYIDLGTKQALADERASGG